MISRLQKIFSDSGVMSRRACEQAIADGRVAVNGVTAELGQKADPEPDVITLDGIPIAKRDEGYTYIMLT